MSSLEIAYQIMHAAQRPGSVVVLRGLPGSGKSTVAAHLKARGHFEVVSADDYFVGVDGTYKFDPNRLLDAHAACMRKFLNAVASGRRVVVDNTNIKGYELTPYVSVANAYGVRNMVVTLKAQLMDCLLRQRHGVPEEALCRMAAALTEPLPPWVDQFTFQSGGSAA